MRKSAPTSTDVRSRNSKCSKPDDESASYPNESDPNATGSDDNDPNESDANDDNDEWDLGSY
jgi:hypothetical protein